MGQSACAFIKLNPVMDMEKAVELEERLENAVHRGKKKIYLDFSDVDFLCSYMMRVFIKFHKTWSRAGIELGIQYFNDYSKDSLKMAGLAEMFTLSEEWKEECGLT